MSQLQELPEPQEFVKAQTELQSSDPIWGYLETFLRFSHASNQEGQVELIGASELVSEAATEAFEQTYNDFIVVDLWLNVDDSVVSDVVEQGLDALGAEMLVTGVPLGMLTMGDTEYNTDRTMILCKAVLGRSLPTTIESIQSVPDAPLPPGYQSLCFISEECEEACEVGFAVGRFKHNFIVPNTALVLPTHCVQFTVEQVAPQSGQSSWETPSMMSMLQVRPEALDATYREQILSVCDPDSDLDNLSVAVEQSHEAMRCDLASLAEGLKDLKATLESSNQNVKIFKENSLQQSDNLRNSMVDYLAHSMQVNQYIRDSQFKMKRAQSDLKRLQELHLHMQNTLSPEQYVVSYKPLSTMKDNMLHEINTIVQQPLFHTKTMALTQKNKRIVGLRRKAMLRDDVIKRLAGCLRSRDMLKPEDEELISGF